MKVLLPSIFLLLTTAGLAAPGNVSSPSDVINRLVANASKNPPGPVENDVTEQTLKTVTAMTKAPEFKGEVGSVRESIAAEYNQFTLEGPLTPLYAEGLAALFSGKVRLTDDAFADNKDSPADNPPGFGDGGGFSDFIGPTVKDKHVIATFCLVQQHGLWKVHGVYLSNEMIHGAEKDFIIRQLSAFAKKP